MKSSSGTRQLKVPKGRLSRFLELSRAAGSMMTAGAVESARRFADKAAEDLPHVLLTGDSARRLALRLSRLRGAAMKVGQMLSLEGDNLLPAEFAKALEVLRSSAHHMPDAQVQQMLCAEYGADFATRFAQFEFEPLAAASIGQVHRAVTHGGEELVLKIQYPGVRESIDSDVDNLKSLLSLARLVPSSVDIDSFAEVLKKELRQEVDYVRELAMLTMYRQKILADDRFLLPRPEPEHSTSRILAMERLDATPLLTWAREASQQDRDRVGSLLFELLLRELFEFHMSQTDPNPSNYQYDARTGRVILLDFGAAREVMPNVAQIYRKAFWGLMDRDVDLLQQVLVDLGAYNPGIPEAMSLLIELSLEAAEAFDTPLYDFAASDLQRRLNTRGREMVKYRDQLTPPPPEYIFFQRKLTGTFLMCRQLGARVPCRALVERVIGGPGL